MAIKLNHSGIRPVNSNLGKRVKTLGLMVGLLTAILAFYWLARYSAYLLVLNDEFEHTPYTLILDGQGADMLRSEYALELLSEGKTDTIIVAGRRVFKHKNNAELARTEMLSQGDFNPNQILTFHHDDASTIEEATSIIPYFKARRVDTVLLVTSAMAAARVRSIFEGLTDSSGPVYLSTNMNYRDYVLPENWMQFRSGKKTWLIEMLKRCYTVLELWGIEEVNTIPGKKYRFGHDTESDLTIPKEAIVTDDLNIFENDSLDVLADSTLKDTVLDSLLESVEFNFSQKDSLKP